jgi:hypothetical protein
MDQSTCSPAAKCSSSSIILPFTTATPMTPCSPMIHRSSVKAARTSILVSCSIIIHASIRSKSTTTCFQRWLMSRRIAASVFLGALVTLSSCETIDSPHTP